jgi:Fe-S-cluster containining protein
MELGEATALAGRFILSILFKAHSLPIGERADNAMHWWRNHESRIPLRPALEEQRKHLSQFASRRQAEKQRGRQILLTISATVDDDGQGRCPALGADDRCGIYEARPLTCRTVPMHYSRPRSTLRAYLDRFTATPGYRCDTTADAPIVLDGSRILEPSVERYREEAVDRAKADRAWKDRLLALMDDEAAARSAELPTYEAVLRNTDDGFATSLPMIVAWRVAERHGLLSREALKAACQGQATLIRAEIGRGPTATRVKELLAILAIYEAELAGRQHPAPKASVLTDAAHSIPEEPA